jgi:hypothetical protein
VLGVRRAGVEQLALDHSLDDWALAQATDAQHWKTVDAVLQRCGPHLQAATLVALVERLADLGWDVGALHMRPRLK